MKKEKFLETLKKQHKLEAVVVSSWEIEMEEIIMEFMFITYKYSQE